MNKNFLTLTSLGLSAGISQAAITSVVETGRGADAAALIENGAFAEDALTFSDRTHEHNGAAFDAGGLLSTVGANIIDLPGYLVGGDYVRFANNARENVGYTAVVTADSPTDWFLLVDNRIDAAAGNNNSSNTTDPVLGGSLQWSSTAAGNASTPASLPTAKPTTPASTKAAMASAQARDSTSSTRSIPSEVSPKSPSLATGSAATI